MRKMGVIAAAICAVCLILPFEGGGISLGVAQDSQRLTSQEAIAAARPNAKPGSSFTVLREIVATADTRRIGDQSLKEAQAHHIKLFEDGILVDFLRSGGFLIAEYDPNTTNVIALHLVSLGPHGVPKDDFYPSDSGEKLADEEEPVVKLADAEELVKDTTEFMEEFYSTPPSQASSFESSIYGGSFPEWCLPRPSGQLGPTEDCDLFGIPRSLLKLGADPNEVQEVAALSGGYNLSGFQYAVSMPVFAASPLAATRAVEDQATKVLRKNHLDPDFNFDLDNIQSKEQLRKEIDLLRELNNPLQEDFTHRNEADPALVKANISIAAIPLGVGRYGPFYQGDKTQFGSGTASLLVIYWQRLPTGGFAVTSISEADADTGE